MTRLPPFTCPPCNCGPDECEAAWTADAPCSLADDLTEIESDAFPPLNELPEIVALDGALSLLGKR